MRRGAAAGDEPTGAQLPWSGRSLTQAAAALAALLEAIGKLGWDALERAVYAMLLDPTSHGTAVVAGLLAVLAPSPDVLVVAKAAAEGSPLDYGLQSPAALAALLPKPGATAAIVATPPAGAGAHLRRLLAAHLVRTVNKYTRPDLAAAIARLLFHDPALAANRTVWSATVGRLQGEALLAALAEAIPRMTLPLPPPPGDNDGGSSGGGSAGGSAAAPFVESSYQQAFGALAAAAMAAVGLIDGPALSEGSYRGKFLEEECHAVTFARALFRVDHGPSLVALIAAVPVIPADRLRPLLTDNDLLALAAPRGVTGPALARLATAIKARVAAGPPQPPPFVWAMTAPPIKVLVQVMGNAADAAKAAAWYASAAKPNSRPSGIELGSYGDTATARVAADKLPATGDGWTTTVEVSGRKPHASVRVTKCDAAARKLRSAWEAAQADARCSDAFLAAVPLSGAAAAGGAATGGAAAAGAAAGATAAGAAAAGTAPPPAGPTCPLTGGAGAPPLVLSLTTADGAVWAVPAATRVVVAGPAVLAVDVRIGQALSVSRRAARSSTLPVVAIAAVPPSVMTAGAAAAAAAAAGVTAPAAVGWGAAACAGGVAGGGGDRPAKRSKTGPTAGA